MDSSQSPAAGGNGTLISHGNDAAASASGADDSMQNLSQISNSIEKTLGLIHQLSLTVSTFNSALQMPLLQRINGLVAELDNMVKLAEKCNIQVPMEVVNLIDDGKNPDEFTKDVINNCIAKNQITKGKTDALKDLRKHLLEELEQNFPDEVETFRENRAAAAAELKLKHTISNEILIYPGYVPEPNVKYRVFHYGLRFSVGNWSFDKADWRVVDVVNKCWAKFPDPPDPSTLDQANKENLRRDMLSIECGKTLNEALELHHKKKCPSADSILISKGDEKTEESGTSREIGNTDGTIDSVTNRVATNHSEELASVQKEELPSVQKDEIPSSFRFWVVFLWAFSGFGFLVVIFVVCSGHRRRGTRMKHHSRRRRSMHSGFMESNGRDRHGRDVDL